MAGLLVFAALGAPARAAGPYISGSAGANVAGSWLSTGAETDVGTNPGPMGLMALGWTFGDGLRAEVEGSYRSNGIDSIATRRVNGLLVPLTQVSGTVATFATMANAIYDLPFRPFGLPIHPYIGGGLGYAWLSFGGASGSGLGEFLLPNNNVFVGPDVVRYGSGGAFAYQAIAGASVPLQMLPGLETTLEYRFFGTADAQVSVKRVATGNNLVNGMVPSSVARNGLSEQNNAVLIGLRYAFGPS